jgi:FtsH-binding integral membrane protein
MTGRGQLTDADVLTTVVLGLLIPALLTRPKWLEPSDSRLSQPRRRRIEFLYSVGAIAGLVFAYLAIAEVFASRTDLSEDGQDALGGASLLLLLIVVSVHLVPLWAPHEGLGRRALMTGWALLAGMTFGSVFAANVFEPVPLGDTPLSAAIFTLASVVFAVLGAYAHSSWREISCWARRRVRRSAGGRRPVWKQ